MAGRLRNPVLVSAAGIAGLALVWLLAYRVGPAQRLDGWGFEVGQERVYYSGTTDLVQLLLVPMFVPFYALAATALLVVAWRRHGPARAVFGAGVLLGANGLTQVLKELTAESRPWSTTSWGATVDVVSWPSGHATASAVLVVLAVAAATPQARRRVAAWGLVWLVAVGLAVVALGWHMPSDTLGAWCVVAAVGGAAVAALRVWTARAVPRRTAARAVAPAQSA